MKFRDVWNAESALGVTFHQEGDVYANVRPAGSAKVAGGRVTSSRGKKGQGARQRRKVDLPYSERFRLSEVKMEDVSERDNKRIKEERQGESMDMGISDGGSDEEGGCMLMRG